MPTKPQSIDDYLETVSPERRAALQKLRKTIHSILPDVEETISYSMPAFRVGKHVVAGFLATAKGCSYFPFSGTTLDTLAKDLSSYSQTKSALHFEPERGLPTALLRKLLAARIAEAGAAVPKPSKKASAKPQAPRKKTAPSHARKAGGSRAKSPRRTGKKR